MGNYCTCVNVEPSELLDTSLTEDDPYKTPSVPPSRANRKDPVEGIDEVYLLDSSIYATDGILGSSSIGTVVKTKHRKSQTMRAVKQISKRNIEGDGWKGEIQTIKELDHKHICKIHETWEDARSVYLCMELCRGGSLMNLSKRHEKVNESVIASLVWQMASAVGHLHKHNVVHSDINPENWLFGEAQGLNNISKDTAALDTNLKMIDFGLANKHGKNTHSRRKSGHSLRGLDRTDGMPTLSFQRGISAAGNATNKRLNLKEQQSLFCKSPEQLDNLPGSHDNVYWTQEARDRAAKADVWALGVLAYFLLSGQSPFHGSAETKDVQIRHARFVFMPPDLWRPVSSEAKNFIALCLQADPMSRPSATKALALPWMQLARGVIEEHEMRNAGKTMPEGSNQHRLSLMDPPLPSGMQILSSFDHMNALNALEKAGVIAAAHHLATERIIEFQQKLIAIDKHKEGLLSIRELFEALLDTGVPCEDLLRQVKEIDHEGCVAVEYAEFLTSVDDFQRNMQESSVWAVFKSFDSPEGTDGVLKKDLCKVLGQENLRNCLVGTFPHLMLEKIVRDMNKDGDGTIDFDQFTQVLRGTGKPMSSTYDYYDNSVAVR